MREKNRRRISLKEVQQSTAYEKLSSEEKELVDSLWSSTDYQIPPIIDNLGSWIMTRIDVSRIGEGAQCTGNRLYDPRLCAWEDHTDEWQDHEDHEDHEDHQDHDDHNDHSDGHWDEGHEDSYNDVPHFDNHGDHDDNVHSDVHSDSQHWDEYNDAPHGDGSHGDGGHADVHGDQPGPHGDHVEHGDDAYNDFHYDMPHRDHYDSYLPGDGLPAHLSRLSIVLITLCIVTIIVVILVIYQPWRFIGGGAPRLNLVPIWCMSSSSCGTGIGKSIIRSGALRDSEMDMLIRA